jgi:hypothetical protein
MLGTSEVFLQGFSLYIGGHAPSISLYDFHTILLLRDVSFQDLSSISHVVAEEYDYDDVSSMHDHTQFYVLYFAGMQLAFL